MGSFADEINAYEGKEASPTDTCAHCGVTVDNEVFEKNFVDLGTDFRWICMKCSQARTLSYWYRKPYMWFDHKKYESHMKKLRKPRKAPAGEKNNFSELAKQIAKSEKYLLKTILKK